MILPKWSYYFAMPFDLVFRCAWLFTVAPAPFSGYVYDKALEICLAAAEITRRGNWNIFRLANEQTQLQLVMKASLVSPDRGGLSTFDTFEKEKRSIRKLVRDEASSNLLHLMQDAVNINVQENDNNNN